MLILTIDREWLLKEIRRDEDKALGAAKKLSIPGLTNKPAVIHHFNKSTDKYQPHSPTHTFLQIYEPRIGNDVVVLG